jgi:hypothetical protein
MRLHGSSNSADRRLVRAFAQLPLVRRPFSSALEGDCRAPDGSAPGDNAQWLSDFARAPAQCHGASECSRSSSAPGYALDWSTRPESGGNPQLRFSSAIRTSRFEISLEVGGRPGVRNALPSYFFAINFRCHANKVSGVTIVPTCARTFRPNFLPWPQAAAADYR